MSTTTQTNSNSVISLILGILSIVVPIIGLALGVVGIILSNKAKKEIDKTNESGRELAISGYVCSLVGVILQLIGLLGLISFSFFTISG